MKLYVGIDISKNKFDAVFTLNGEIFFEHNIYLNNEKGFQDLLEKSKSILQKEHCDEIHFIMEATGMYHFNLSEFLLEAKQNVSVINPYQTKAFSKSILLRTKNDKTDSSMLAMYGILHNPPKALKQNDKIKKFKHLVRYKEYLTELKSGQISKLKSSLNSNVKKFIENNINCIKEQIKEVIIQIKKIIHEDSYLTKKQIF